MRAGRQVQENETQRQFLGLKAMAKMLPIPDCDMLVARHHDAGADANITCSIYVTVLRIVSTEIMDQQHTDEPAEPARPKPPPTGKPAGAGLAVA